MSLAKIKPEWVIILELEILEVLYEDISNLLQHVEVNLVFLSKKKLHGVHFLLIHVKEKSLEAMIYKRENMFCT